MRRKKVIGYILIPEEVSEKYYEELVSELKRKKCHKVICDKIMSPTETKEFYKFPDDRNYDIDEIKDKCIMRQSNLLDQIKFNLKEGDVLMVLELNMLNTSVSGVIRTLHILSERKVGFKSIKDAIDTTKINDETIFNLFYVCQPKSVPFDLRKVYHLALM
jgi:hypothetical protein